MKYLIAGLGNIGAEYLNTRHNIGFMILDAISIASNIVFESGRYAYKAEYRFKGRNLILCKPTTYMNLSGKAVRYWMEKERIGIQNLLVVVDDLALPFGTIRMKSSGNNGGHNGLKNIDEVLGTNNYARLRFGIGNDFLRGQQVDYVLSPFTLDEDKIIQERIKLAADAIRCFTTAGIQTAMNNYNNK